MSVGNHCLIRKKRPRARWADPGVPEHFPKWFVKLSLPGQPAKWESSKMDICGDCMAVPATVSPTVARPDCRCQKPVKRWAAEWHKTEATLWQDGRIETLRAMRAKRDAPTVDEFERVYLANVPAQQRKGAKKNMRCIRAIIEEATGRAAGAQRMSALTQPLALTWIRLRQAWYAGGQKPSWADLRRKLDAGQLPGVDRGTALPGNNTINSYINCAQAALGRTARAYYLPGLALPPMEDFLAVGKLPAPKGFVPIPAEDYSRLHAAHAALHATDLQLWFIVALLRYLGLRSIEVAAARPGWIEREGEAACLVLRNRPEEGFHLKARARAIERRLSLAPELLAAMTQVATDDSLIGARNKSDAYDLVYRKASKFLRPFLAGRRGAAHEMRKHLGSVIYSAEGLETAAANLGHATTDTTKQVYVAPLMALPMIDAARLAPAAG